MTLIINHPDDLLDQYVQATLLTHPHLAKHADLPLIYDRHFDGQTIPILSGGGSGHEPAHAGYVGQGMLTAALYGDIFVPPTAQEVFKAIQFLNRGQGVFVIIKNFEADLASFRAGIEAARAQGIPVRYVVSHDDISVDIKARFRKRHRGLAGTIFLHKILGAASQAGASLNQLEELGLTVSLNTATIGFATSSARLPQTGQALFDLPEGQISYGIGIHGEEGYRTVAFTSAEQLANEIINKLKLRFRWQEGQAFILMVNNLGTLSELEQATFLNDIRQLLELEGLTLPFITSGKFMTSLNMAGLSVSLCSLEDQLWLDYLKADTTAFAW